MIKASDIYAASHDGLDIILYYYPQAEGCVDNRKKFKIRPDEDDASACIRKYGDCYKVTDFGDQGTATSPIDICMREEHVSFGEAVVLLAARYNVSDELKHSVNKPDIRKRPASADEAEGSRFFELEEAFTPEQLAILGPRVKQEHCDALHWHVAKSISYVKNREVTTKYTTPTYPILMRQCVIPGADGKPESEKSFYKIYEPLNPDKQWRFSYTPDGVKPRYYTNGLYELKAAWAKWNASQETQFFDDPANEGKPYISQKLEEAFICSGERDALCVRALGYYPLWFNSETQKITSDEIKEIMKYVKRLYNIPDIDSTGIRKGTELALEFLHIYTVWLPESLGRYRDRRGKPRKDFRDYVELHPSNEDFRNLLALAMPAQYWEEKIGQRNGNKTYTINSSYLHYFLRLNGYYILKDDNSDTPRYVHVDRFKVSEIKAGDIVSFLKSDAMRRFLPVDIRNLILDSPRVGGSGLSMLDEIDLNFTAHTFNSQTMFFDNVNWKITGSGIEEVKEAGGVYVWTNNIIPHKVKVLPEPFTIKRAADGGWDVTINPHDSHYMDYLINSSRVHWRKELEELWADKDQDQAAAYRAEHKFDLAGPLLSAEEIHEQKQNFVNKIFAVGYNLHRYKSPSRAWAVYAMDNKIGEEGQCNGRSGKSFFLTSLKQFLRTVVLSGRNPKLMDNNHVFEQVNQHTDFIIVDDCHRYLDTGLFYDSITGGMTVNPKNNHSFYIEFESSPKFAFSTNYVPGNFDSSSDARLIYTVFSDYYHQKTDENDYLETRSIYDDFGKNLFSQTDYTESEWNADLNFFARCLQFYLSTVHSGIKIQPPMGNIMKRKHKADMGDNFEAWANTYFAKDSGNLDRLIVRKKAYDDFKDFAKVTNTFWSMQRFTKALKGFAALCPYVQTLNPESMRNGSDRITRKVDGKSEDMIYLQSVGSTIDELNFNANIEDDDSGDPF